MLKIPLRGKKGEGLYTLVDREDFEKFGHLKWTLNTYGYAYANIKQLETKKHKTFYLHRLLMDNPEGLQVDHINHDRLDNRKENLRICTSTENNRNRTKRLDTPNKYKGVSLRNKKYRAAVKIAGKTIHLGYFKTQEEAAMAYNEAAYIYFGEFAKLNKVIL
jgi:hypothetical protein